VVPSNVLEPDNRVLVLTCKLLETSKELLIVVLPIISTSFRDAVENTVIPLVGVTSKSVLTPLVTLKGDPTVDTLAVIDPAAIWDKFKPTIEDAGRLVSPAPSPSNDPENDPETPAVNRADPVTSKSPKISSPDKDPVPPLFTVTLEAVEKILEFTMWFPPSPLVTAYLEGQVILSLDALGPAIKPDA